MARFKLTNKAVDDLENIWNYTNEQWSEKQADKYYTELIDACEFITDNPNVARKYEEVGEEIFGFLFNKHLLFFQKINAEEILIVRILHASMDIKNRISK
ncbi:type II toxin-antitoxin system RelE/ParE family toxin [Kaistella daneshvariae]|uniref:Toxin n=1 Tax=Kaistella daneshvariae TaxID=2487074 RepID=A0ABN5T3N1_9FLAO|nr:type II toxin-antitoxin system RelE/ParE family toxin [Kaistella daneshvariae]AZI68251.1 type II toxin-antitoxin system RelE/ParE family toxin [Kaistella daneshvariae]